MAFLRGYGGVRVCAFTQANVNNINAAQVLYEGLRALSLLLGKRPGPIPALAAGTTAPAKGLLQAVYWENAGALQSAAKIKAVAVDAAAQRTDLFGAGPLADVRARADVSMVELRGMLKIVNAGGYRFRLSSDDGSVMWLDDEVVVINDGDHPLLSKESQEITLGTGNHPIRLQWYNAGGAGSLFLEWRTPAGTGYEAVPDTSFTPL